ncbi:MAG: DegV family protein [Oscillospiraceae bacterium]|jgi:DegV family protein with EDD domain|nr:DegV family protein [Oscillospiraceae bacterium]
MPDYVITCCSTADLPREYFEKRNVPLGYFKFTMNGKEYIDDLGETMPFKDFYAAISAGAMPVTSQLNISEYIALFEPFLKEGTDVLHLALSGGISGSYNSGKMAEQELRTRYPERKIYVIDSLAASSGYGLLLDKVLDMRDAGKPIDEINNWVEENKLKMHHWFFTSDLTHLKRGGRVSSAAAILGAFLNICPILNVNSTGHLIPRSKARGKKNVIADTVALMKKHAQGGTNYDGKCFISNSNCYEDARALADSLEKQFPNLNGGVQIFDIGTVIGSHTGPGTVALFFWGDERGE